MKLCLGLGEQKLPRHFQVGFHLKSIKGLAAGFQETVVQSALADKMVGGYFLCREKNLRCGAEPLNDGFYHRVRFCGRLGKYRQLCDLA